MGGEIGKKSLLFRPGRLSPEWTARVSKRLRSPIVPYTLTYPMTRGLTGGDPILFAGIEDQEQRFPRPGDGALDGGVWRSALGLDECLRELRDVDKLAGVAGCRVGG